MTGHSERPDQPCDLAIHARRAVTPDGETACWVGVRGGRIAAITPYDRQPAADDLVELPADSVLLPGLVDTHVHINEPGRTAWEGFATATMAAAAGGVTTLIDMPLNSIPPTVDLAALAVKRAAAETQVHVDVGFWGGAVPTSIGRLASLHLAGVFGFKCFLLHSGVDEFPPLTGEQLIRAMRAIHEFDGLLIVHAEDATTIRHLNVGIGTAYAGFLSSRPRGAENLAIARVIELARRIGTRVHILHLSSSDALPMIASARRDGVRITVETCPHYLTLNAEDVPDRATQFKCCPPIRESANQDLLWEGLLDGIIDFVVTDHSPSTVDLKGLDSGDFGAAWGGISSLQIGLPAVWTAARSRGVPLATVVNWMSAGPARVAGLSRKGRLEVGYDADFSEFAPDESFVVDAARLHHRNPITPYAGRELAGVVRRTWLRGQVVDGVQPRGELLTR